MDVKIILRKDHVYDVYDRASGRWLFSTAAPENVFSNLGQMPCVQIDFVDETIPAEMWDAYCASTGALCSLCQIDPCELRKEK